MTPEELLNMFPSVFDLPDCYKAKLDIIRAVNIAADKLACAADEMVIATYYNKLKIYQRRFLLRA